ncbi:extracellular solute-binding protein [Streptomyces sp. SCUT-3]|uniref:ABC transporter substrate-binding protein n=1 Tax=Streptomyces sp. SCUT-3 TaxID=2684469 RepID=UPI000CBEB977|nr:extracellular solute-binding protein [Streptomyces sp. SCUT-3]PLW74498.1 sugar-binding protein [Streptomyces sp. DJ]QMV23851.1 extracellular solute-binding protein [Streptomyces sp. SCUT-3]
MTVARAARTGAVLLAGVLLLTACGSGSSGTSAGGTGKEPITLTVDLFGSFGYKQAGLYEKYEKLNPGITIKETDTEDEADYWKALQTRLAGGGGLADVQGIEVGRISSVVQRQSDKFEDLGAFGAKKLEKDFAEGKWSAATTADGRILGLGTDVGPEALCYRSDLLEKAGLPTDRDELAEKWSTWDGYLDLGRQYKKKAPKGSRWIDSVGSLYSIMTGQEEERYYDSSGELIHTSNPAVKKAWDTAVDAAEDGLSAELDQWSPEWNQAFSSGSFATIPCPSWMLSYIKGQVGEKGAGTWDVAKLPEGAGNWGGSYLSVPKGAKHPKEAFELVKWLTAEEQQAELFTEQGLFPSNLGAIDRVRKYEDPYFSRAPIGEIFGAAAEQAPVQVLGVHDGDIHQQFTNALSEVEKKGTPSMRAWDNAVKGVDNVLG